MDKNKQQPQQPRQNPNQSQNPKQPQQKPNQGGSNSKNPNQKKGQF